MEVEPALEELLQAELVDQVKFTAGAEYAFRHPLIRTVAYESQLKADRANLHRQLAAAIQGRNPEKADENAALIAEHLEAAEDLHAAFSWHMRAGAWSTNRDIAAAHVSWERARQIADALPKDDPDRVAMRIAPRTLICANGFRVHTPVAGAQFAEVQELARLSGTSHRWPSRRPASLAIIWFLGVFARRCNSLWNSRCFSSQLIHRASPWHLRFPCCYGHDERRHGRDASVGRDDDRCGQYR